MGNYVITTADFQGSKASQQRAASGGRGVVSPAAAATPLWGWGRELKLDAAKVSRIRRLAKLGVGRLVLAKEFGVSGQTISNVVWRRTWRHVP